MSEIGKQAKKTVLLCLVFSKVRTLLSDLSATLTNRVIRAYSVPSSKVDCGAVWVTLSYTLPQRPATAMPS